MTSTRWPVTGSKVKASSTATRKVRDRLRHGGLVDKVDVWSQRDMPSYGLSTGMPCALVVNVDEDGNELDWRSWVGVDQLSPP